MSQIEAKHNASREPKDEKGKNRPHSDCTHSATDEVEVWQPPAAAFSCSQPNPALGDSEEDQKDVPDLDQDSVCNICRTDEGDETNPLVFCDKCGVCVHSECYGNPLMVKIPEDEWVCDRCEQNAMNEMCVMCPVRYGAMKRTTDWKWCHLSCAMWIPEVFFRNGDGREPIDILQIPAHRWGNKCCHCNSSYGAQMICGHAGCGRMFHITCGLMHNIFLEYKVVRNSADVIVALCYEHSKKYQSKKKGR